MSYPRKYTGHRISSEYLIPGSIPDPGSAVNVLSQEVCRTQDPQRMSYPRKYTGPRIGSECLIPGSLPDTGSAVNVLSQEVNRTQDHIVEARMNGGFSYIYVPNPLHESVS